MIKPCGSPHREFVISQYRYENLPGIMLIPLLKWWVCRQNCYAIRFFLDAFVVSLEAVCFSPPIRYRGTFNFFRQFVQMMTLLSKLMRDCIIVVFNRRGARGVACGIGFVYLTRVYLMIPCAAYRHSKTSTISSYCIDRIKINAQECCG